MILTLFSAIFEAVKMSDNAGKCRIMSDYVGKCQIMSENVGLCRKISRSLLGRNLGWETFLLDRGVSKNSKNISEISVY